MALWSKAGETPGQLPFQDADPTGRVWTDLANNAEGRLACGWAHVEDPPAHGPDQVAVWRAGEWVLEGSPPVLSAAMRIAKFWLFERLTDPQERAFAKLEFRARNLSPADIDDPANEELFQLQRFIRRLDALTVVELDAPQTVAGFELLRLLGIA